MACNLDNVYKGPNSLRDYYNPDVQPPLPLVEIPAAVNHFRKDGVRIYAKMMTMLPAHNVKALPALNMLSEAPASKASTIVEYSSGSTVISMSMIARVLHNIRDTHAFLSNKTSVAKLQLMQFFGLEITLFGGPSQPEPCDSRGGIQAARNRSREDETIYNPNQYENNANWGSHYKWTGPQILKQLPEVNVICTGMGTSGTMTGIGTFFRDNKPSVKNVAVCTAAGQRVPGPRSKALMGPVEFPWKAAVDTIEEVGEIDSYTLSMQLSREGLVCGPSSGFNLQGLYQYLAKQKEANTLDSLRNEDGEIHCVFLCCDLPYQYMSEYFSKLPQDVFPRIRNENLVNVDTYRYDEAWELDGLDAIVRAYGSIQNDLAAERLSPELAVIDLRTARDFAGFNLAGSISMPVHTLSPGTNNPFRDSLTLESQWDELHAVFIKGSPRWKELEGKKVFVLCYDGDTSRVACSILRAQGIEAWSIGGGLRDLEKILPSPSTSGQATPELGPVFTLGLPATRPIDSQPRILQGLTA
ncbi:Pyridoxal-phosphate dependent enzyme-like protein 5 [Acrodontium crateriforme]|uniref:Pyridoxal-phosphate dependent enzyme-like protein 5 n=1 Tax=Acrodontium crateriforme TaxID=150365 RepID=A0AAQ3R5A8_9PEZI|nr:Pyridoxal-phosphate dependent enzyme-like protein 5 [Acrodontium crateriforme]